MYRALYKFECTDQGVLSFDVDDKFTIMDDSSSDWCLVQNSRGQTGYAPKNYLASDDVALTEVLKSIDRAIETIQRQSEENSGTLTNELFQNLQRLQNHRKKIVEENNAKQMATVDLKNLQTSENSVNSKDLLGVKIQRQAPPPPQSTQTFSSLPSNNAAKHPSLSFSVGRQETVKSTCHEKTEKLLNTVYKESKTEIGGKPSSGNDDTPCHAAAAKEQSVELKGLGNDLVEHVRRNTLLSYDLSKVAIRTVLTLLADRIPSICQTMDKVLEEVMNDQGTSLEGSNDATQLQKLLEALAAAKDDSQQRSWFLHEDEDKICSHLQELNSILDGANPETSRKVLALNGYAACQNLALYYQMEVRRSIRLLLLQSFGSMCSLDSHIISELFNSVLPLELARDIQNDLTDVQKVMYSALVLSMVFSTGEAIPLQYYAHLNANFINFLLEQIEMPDQDEEQEQIVDGFIRLLLAFNLHFELPNENLVMKAFAVRGTAKNFTEKILLMINREDDPVRMFDHLTHCPNSVLKFISDLYSCRDTSNLLYTNDAKVLIDIIVRQLTDLSPGDRMRTEYLSLMHLLLKNSEYLEHKHRKKELQLCFQRISQDEKDAEMDKDIVWQIWKEFPEDFYNAI